MLRISAVLVFVIFQIFSTTQYSFSQTANFTANPLSGSFCAPANIKFQPEFSETPISYFWQFGFNDEESDANSPSFTYTTPGTYKVVLVVLFSNAIIEVENPITIYGSPILKLNASKTAICKPDQINFNLQSNLPLSSINWDFGDGFTQIGDGSFNSVSHFFNQFMDYNVQATAISNQGCSGIANSIISLQKPTASVSAIPLEGCVPVKVAFEANVSVPSGSAVTAYIWKFDDGSPDVSGTANNYIHSYNGVGTFKPSVSIITLEGCTNSYDFSPVITGGTPTRAKISVASDTICASEKAVFYELNGNATNYIWEISNGAKNETIIGELTYQFNNLGNYVVKVTPENNGCLGVADSLNIEVQGVIAGFSYRNTCSNKSRFTFRNTSRGRSSEISWDFGDGIPELNIARPVHQFPPSGVFPIKLYVKDNVTGCSDSTSTLIYTAEPILVPTDTFFCRGTSATLKVIETYQNPRALYIWRIAGQTISNSPDSAATVNLSSFGTFSNRVIINNGSSYCRDTLLQPTNLRVGGPVAAFESPPNICIESGLALFDSSKTGFGYDSIIRWNWNFDNGTTSNLKNPDSIQFNTSGNYRVRLTVTDVKGCKDSVQNTIRAKRLPLLRIIPGNQKVCENQSITLSAVTRTPVNWMPENEVSCPTCESVTVTPKTPTTYTATTTDPFGCTTEQSVTLDVWKSFTLPPNMLKDTGICPGGIVSFDLKTTDKIVQWTPSSGITNPANPSILVNPMSTTRYTAAVSDSGRCFTQSVGATVVVNPQPLIDMGPDLILPYNTSFTLRPLYTGGSNIISYTWQPANLLSCQNCPFPTGRATQQSFYTVDVVTDKGCISSGRIQVSVECSPDNVWMPTAFSPNNDGLNDTYYPLTRGISEIKKFIIYNRFGELVFQRSNFKPNDNSLGWNGSYNGKLQPTGGFVYFVEAVCELGGMVSKKGNFVIIR